MVAIVREWLVERVANCRIAIARATDDTTNTIDDFELITAKHENISRPSSEVEIQSDSSDAADDCILLDFVANVIDVILQNLTNDFV